MYILLFKNSSKDTIDYVPIKGQHIPKKYRDMYYAKIYRKINGVEENLYISKEGAIVKLVNHPRYKCKNITLSITVNGAKTMSLYYNRMAHYVDVSVLLYLTYNNIPYDKNNKYNIVYIDGNLNNLTISNLKCVGMIKNYKKLSKKNMLMDITTGEITTYKNRLDLIKTLNITESLLKKIKAMKVMPIIGNYCIIKNLEYRVSKYPEFEMNNNLVKYYNKGIIKIDMGVPRLITKMSREMKHERRMYNNYLINGVLPLDVEYYSVSEYLSKYTLEYKKITNEEVCHG